MLGAYLLMILRMVYLSYYTQERFGQMVIIGVLAMMLFHVFQNVAMTIGYMPITGIPLPFLSYGGSNLVTNMAGIGLVLNMVMNRSVTSMKGLTPQTRHQRAVYGMMRLFIGLGLGGDVRDALFSAVSGMNVRGQLVPKDNYHLTLAFLGMREERQVKQLERIIAAAAKEHPPQTLTVQGSGYFGRRENALLYGKLAPSRALSALLDTLRGCLPKRGRPLTQSPSCRISRWRARRT